MNKNFTNLLRNTTVWTYLLKIDLNIETNGNSEGKYIGELLNKFVKTFTLKRQNILIRD